MQLLIQQQSALATSSSWASVIDELRTWYLPGNIADINVLGTVTANPDSRVELRIAAASALARLHSRETLPLLAQLLAEPNSRLQALAVGGFASFANNVPAGSHQPAAGDWKYRTKQPPNNNITT
ncbi:MAG TPA: HEAT repeat domain-containing protein [Bryobacteraceae bacterium]